MGRHARVLSAAALAGLAGVLLAPGSLYAQEKPEVQTARAATRATLVGHVSDDRGGLLHGAMVSALGTTMAMAVTDERGRFELDLPVGEYVLRAHLQGFAASKREFVRVSASGATPPRLKLRRLDNGAAAAASGDPALKGRTILSAGVDGTAGHAEPESSAAARPKDDHPHSETAWRLRHIKRSILKDSAREVVVADSEPERGSRFGRAASSAGNFAASIFTDLPFSGEVNVLTTSAFAPGDFLSGGALPRGVAYLSLGAPTPAGDWLVRAAMSDGDLASWIVAGSFVSRRQSAHAYTLGLSYSTQEYQGGNPIALAAVTENSRNVGEIYAFDRWQFSPAVSLEYGARYGRFDYLEDRSILSPKLAVQIEAMKGTRINAAVAQRMVAPGAEEFLGARVDGPWLPPERTFAPFPGGSLRAERTRYIDFGVEQTLSDGTLIGIRRFFQTVDDQLATLFGVTLPEGPKSVGHYYVTNVGSLDASGWGVRLASPTAARLRAVIDYTLTRAHWMSRGNTAGAALLAAAVLRPEREDIHDITTSLHTEIPETATRVLVLYRINSKYTRPTEPGIDGRFDVQVNQALPFGVAGTKWEVLVGMRNMFRDPAESGSVYDELLVVRPPRRVVGGFLVRF
jgi:hypothetical protein